MLSHVSLFATPRTVAHQTPLVLKGEYNCIILDRSMEMCVWSWINGLILIPCSMTWTMVLVSVGQGCTEVPGAAMYPGISSLLQKRWGRCEILGILLFFGAYLVAQLVKNLPAMQETWVQSLGWEDSLEKGKVTYFSIQSWRIPWTIQSLGSQRIRRDWVIFTSHSFLKLSVSDHSHWYSMCVWLFLHTLPLVQPSPASSDWTRNGYPSWGRINYRLTTDQENKWERWGQASQSTSRKLDLGL